MIKKIITFLVAVIFLGVFIFGDEDELDSYDDYDEDSPWSSMFEDDEPSWLDEFDAWLEEDEEDDSWGSIFSDDDDDYWDEDDYDYSDDDDDSLLGMIIGSVLEGAFGSDWEPGEDWEAIGESGDPDETWGIYWYLCGSDLESNYGAASDDIAEMLEADLPSNVKVIVQTGGASKWKNGEVEDNRIQRYCYSSKGMKLVDERKNSNMGDPRTLASFLSFCEENYPADKKAVIFWDHGGGSVSGAVFDENYDFDSLTLDEFHKAFNAVYDLSDKNPPIDVIGFDACLMATVDTAATFKDIGRYLVASEELEPGSGWNYEDFLEGVAEDPGMDGARMGQVICDSYMKGVGWLSEDEATLSVVDLGRIDPLLDAYEEMGSEALSYALEDPGFFSDFGRKAEKSENYGGNTKDQGYSNMVDLGDLADNCSRILPHTSDDVLDALDDCVLYKVNGEYRANGRGLSCYYSYNGDMDEFYGYLDQGCSESFKYLFGYGFTGELPGRGMKYVKNLGFKEDVLPHVPNLADDGLEEYPLEIDEDGIVTLTLSDSVMDMLKEVHFNLAYVDPEEDLMIMLGEDNDIEEDWDNGIFKDNFRGVWGAIDGHLVHMTVSYEDEDFTEFSVPILLNGDECNLKVVYDYNTESWRILGARKGLDDNGMASKNLIPVRAGDEITTLMYASSLSEDDDFQIYETETFTVTEETTFDETDMGDGNYLMMFKLVDSKNNEAYSQVIRFTVDGDYIDVEILE